jgi:hypothetical protein
MIATRPTTSLRRIVSTSAAAMGISVLCILPPILHFISGPLGPFIGSFIMGLRRQLTTREGLLVGLGMGLMVGAVADLGVAIAEMVSAGSIAMLSPLPIPLVWLIPVVPFAYVAFLGSCGAVIGGYLGRKNEASSPSGREVVSTR